MERAGGRGSCGASGGGGAGGIAVGWPCWGAMEGGGGAACDAGGPTGIGGSGGGVVLNALVRALERVGERVASKEEGGGAGRRRAGEAESGGRGGAACALLQALLAVPPEGWVPCTLGGLRRRDSGAGRGIGSRAWADGPLSDGACLQERSKRGQGGGEGVRVWPPQPQFAMRGGVGLPPWCCDSISLRGARCAGMLWACAQGMGDGTDG